MKRHMGAGDDRPIVLVVDDDEDHVMMLEASFDAAGYAVVTAGSFADASAKLLSCPIDALVADLTLGDGSALDLLTPLGDRRPRVAVVLSGFDRPEDFERARAAGYDAHLVKPTSFDRLTALIADGLRRRASGVQLAKTRAFDTDDPPVNSKRSAG
jgi:DNA-binding response OmpR family regulator